jgi:hypothetical protein
MIELEDLIARHGANIRAKSANGKKNTNEIITHLSSEKGETPSIQNLPAS